jgi:putative Holliday junction resolvase
MPKYLGIDYGKKKCGIAITDSLGMIATAYTFIETHDLKNSLAAIIAREKIDVVVFGIPKRLHGEDAEITDTIRKQKKQIQSLFPNVKVDEYDERFTSKIASHALIEMGATKKQRKEKTNVDKISAVIMLRDYLERTKFKT